MKQCTPILKRIIKFLENTICQSKIINRCFLSGTFIIAFASLSFSQGTRLLRQPTISSEHIAFAYAGDIWVSNLNNQNLVRLTSTPAVESNPHFSPDGKNIAFTSNRSGNTAIYIVPVTGGDAKRLTWHPSSSIARGWTPDGERVIFASTRNTAPSRFDRLWSVSVDGGPAKQLTSQWATNGSFSPDGKQMIIDRVRRWDVEWRAYRGGQNTPLIILNLENLTETLLPNESTTDIQPLWMGESIYFLSDRDWISNIWSYSPKTNKLKQITKFAGSDVKWLDGNGELLVFERDGYLHTLNLVSGNIKQLNITVNGDFPWAETKWEDVSKNVKNVSLSPTGKRVIMESRGEIFTVPVKHGDYRNITQNSSAADRVPIWSPKGNQIAWFSDTGGKGYSLIITSQDGLSEHKKISIGESKMAWEPTWSPDGNYIAFTDDDVRVRIVEIKSGNIKTVDVGGTNLERGSQGLTWSPDSKWLAYSKGGDNNFRRIMVWSQKDNSIRAITNRFADSFSPSWDNDCSHIYFLASTDLALGSGRVNTSSISSYPKYAAYVINLRKEDSSPFLPRSDEETNGKDKSEDDKLKNTSEKGKEDTKDLKKKVEKTVRIDFDNIERRTIALPMPERNYRLTLTGPSGSVFIAERKPNTKGLVLHKFTLKDRKAKEFISGASRISVSSDGNKIIAKVAENWKVMTASKPNGKDGETLKFNFKIKLNRTEEWTQMFEEAWRYERDYFYDKNMHGRDWQEVYERYSPLIPYIKHRTDLTYILDQLNGELSVGHSFVFGGDFPEVEKSEIGLLGADLIAENNHWKIKRIYTTESWNPKLSSPFDRPGMKIQEDYYLVGINGKEMTADDNPYQFLDGTSGRQTIVHINKSPKFKGAWKEIIKPISNENALRQRAWVEDNRRLVDKLSNGRLAYIWVPNTSNPGYVSFNRYFFAQQDKEGAVIDERFNGGGLLDDYMVDLMTRSLRAGLTNEVPNGRPIRLPAGILGPKVLLVNELAGSGGDFFPWVFRQQKVGPLIGTRTWGGLIKSSVHYSLVDGGALTAPDNAVFDPINNKWVGENEGIAPDIKVRQDAVSLEKGIDPQLVRAVKETLILLEKKGKINVSVPKFPTPAVKKEGS